MISSSILMTVLSAVLARVAATSYPLLGSYSGSGFFDGFRYPTEIYDNTTNGDVFWATADNSSLLYVSSADTVILKVDNTTSVAYNDKRYAPKLYSKVAYEAGTVWVMDAVHMPYGCSVWPAFWTQGPDWPQYGEIDIMEGINMQTTNQIALHAEGSGCLATSGATISGDLTYSNCSIGANSDSGCTTNDTNANSYGAGFASAGGGVYVAEYATTGIRVWFLTRSAVPSGLTVGATSIDTSTLGTPVAEYDSSGCDISQYFGAQTLTIDITLCGDWAGLASILEETCPALVGTNTCYTTYVINDAETTYANAYYEINYINVYSSNGTAGTAATQSSSATTTVTAGVSMGTGKSSVASSTSAASAGRRRYVAWEGGIGAAGMGAVTLGMLGGVVALL